MGLVQREAEARGVRTVGVTLARHVTEQVRPPRAYHLRYPFGHPLGEADNPAQQRQIVLDLLEVLATAETPGTIVDAPYRWRRHGFG